MLDVCDEVFVENDTDYIDDILSVLRAYTHRAPAITERLLFYYVLLIYYVTGIDKNYWGSIATLAIPDINKQALNNIKNGCNIESLP